MLDVAQLSLLGGHVALDLVNTIEDRAGEVPDDVLRTPGDLARWAHRVGVTTPEEALPAPTTAELARTKQLREHLHDVLAALLRGSAPPAGSVRALEQAFAQARASRELVAAPDALAWRWQDTPATVRHRVALAAEGLLTDPGLMARTSLCSAQLCGWFYLDESRNRSRRWCSMRGCGTREKARRRAERERGR